jgi:hypothetical protein
MDAQQLFEIWAPADSVWSRWAKPVLFASLGGSPLPLSVETGEAVPPGTGFGVHADPQAAYVVDLPGSAAVDRGIALARDGFRPVPLFNTTRHAAAVLDVEPILARLIAGAAELAGMDIPPQAPPVFLLDSRRLKPAIPLSPGKFDNRWVVFPQDFPSANFLLLQGIQRVVLIGEAGGPDQPQDDLAHVLLRFQQGGLEILRQPADRSSALPLDVKRPSKFRSLFYRALVLAGLRRSSAGGFGAVIPMPSHGGG